SEEEGPPASPLAAPPCAAILPRAAPALLVPAPAALPAMAPRLPARVFVLLKLSAQVPYRITEQECGVRNKLNFFALSRGRGPLEERMSKYLAGLAALALMGAVTLPLQANAAEQHAGITITHSTDLSAQSTDLSARHWRHHWGPRWGWRHRHWG